MTTRAPATLTKATKATKTVRATRVASGNTTPTAAAAAKKRSALPKSSVAGKTLTPPVNAAPRKRLSVEERERQIIEGAIAFFSRHGLDGQMRVLAEGIGITHALLYHYFPTKQALLERVYSELFEGRWQPAWEALLDNPRLPVEEKLTRFYCEYSRFTLNREFTRIFVFSGLSDGYITERFFGLLRTRLFPRLVRETRRFHGLRSRARPSPRELELLLGLHGGMFYTAIRRHVYGQEIHGAEDATMDRVYIGDRVRAYLLSAAQVLENDPPGAVRQTASDRAPNRSASISARNGPAAAAGSSRKGAAPKKGIPTARRTRGGD